MNRKTTTLATQSAVDAAADKLLAAGIRPTVSNIHESIGGSPRGLRALLEDWRNRLAKRLPADQATERMLPEERAEQIVRRAIDEARGSLRDRIRTTRKRLSSLSSPTRPGAGGDRELAIAREAFSRLEQEINAVQSQIVSLVETLNAARREAGTLEKRTGELVKTVRRLKP